MKEEEEEEEGFKRIGNHDQVTRVSNWMVHSWVLLGHIILLPVYG